MKLFACLLLVLLIAATAFADHCVPTPDDIQLCRVSQDYLSSKDANSQADLSLAATLNYFNELFSRANLDSETAGPRVNFDCLQAYSNWFCSQSYREVSCAQDLQIAYPKKVCQAACTKVREECRPNQIETLSRLSGIYNRIPDCSSEQWGNKEDGCTYVTADVRATLFRVVSKNAYNGLSD